MTMGISYGLRPCIPHKAQLKLLNKEEFIGHLSYHGFPPSSIGKESACSAGDPGSIPGLGRSPGEGNRHPLQYSCLENPRREEPGRLQYMGSQRVRHDLGTKPPHWSLVKNPAQGITAFSTHTSSL